MLQSRAVPNRCERVILSLVLIAAAAGGCRDSPTQAATPTVSVYTAHAISPIALLSDSAWDTFETQVSASLTRLDASGRQVGKTQAPLTFHEVYTLSSDSLWHRTMTLDPRPGGSRTTATYPALGVSRMEAVGRETPMIYGANGQVMPSLVGTPSAGRNTAGKDAAATATARPRRGPNRRWAHDLILLPQEAAARGVLLSKTLGEPTRDSRGREVYREQTGSTLRTIVVDPTIESPVEITETNATRTVNTTYTYSLNSDGTSAWSGMQRRVTTPTGGSLLVLHITFSISKKAGV